MFHYPTAPFLLIVCICVGCGPRVTQFDANRVRAMSLERSRDIPTDAAAEDVSAVLVEWFGTPDQPRWPVEFLNDESSRKLVSLKRLRSAAGAVSSDQDDEHSGLYREHCVRCHGISGSGAGAAAMFQSPYPRDLRAGIFKWKSTPREQKPTRDDLSQLLVGGVAGSAMPSFANVNEEDRAALLDYLIYLSVRGETERELLAVAIDELDYEEAPPEGENRISVSPVNEVAVNVLNDVAGSWTGAERYAVAEDVLGVSDEAILRGKEIFHGQITNCAACHGVNGTGQGTTLDYDDWTKDFTTRIGITPEDRDAVKPFVRAGALPPRKINPRHLAGGVLRGGSDPDTIFRRIRFGIAGTPMPGVDVHDDDATGIGLSVRQTWDLVYYVQSLITDDVVSNEF